jgi:ATP-dependent phosphofructokinase / diphosphate-dependent phosphofructokinase
VFEDKRANPSNYALVVLSEGAEWEGYSVHEYGEPDAYGHRKKASVAEVFANEIKVRVSTPDACCHDQESGRRRRN